MLSFTFNKNVRQRHVSNQLSVNGGLFTDEFSVDIDDFPQDTNKIDHLIANNDIPQKVSYWFNIQFNSIADFPFPGSTTTKKLTAYFHVGTYSTNPAFANLEFFSGEDPQFQNVTNISVSPTADNYYYLSDNLRIFNFTPGITPTPSSLIFANPYQSLNDYLNFLNTNYSNLQSVNPFTGNLAVFPQPSNALTDYSSVAPYTYVIDQQYTNYNFAICESQARWSKRQYHTISTSSETID
jgi:hypothetical protein